MTFWKGFAPDPTRCVANVLEMGTQLKYIHLEKAPFDTKVDQTSSNPTQI